MKKNQVFVHLLLLAMLAGFGCSSTHTVPSNQVWYKPGTSAEERRRDLAMCQNEVLVNGRSYSPIPADTVGHAIILGMLASSSESSRQNQIIQTCMIEKGYSLVSTNSPLLTNSQTTDSLGFVVTAEAAANWKTKAEKGDAGAQFCLAACYLYGQSVPQDYAEAVKWLRKSADQGFSEAQYSLGACYANGEGVPQNDLEAYIWFNLAATRGDKQSARARDKEASRLSREDISEGQRRAAAFVPRTELPGN